MARPRILDAQGKPASQAVSQACPQCGASKKDRVASSGFGMPHPVCGRCGHEFPAEKWTN